MKMGGGIFKNLQSWPPYIRCKKVDKKVSAGRMEGPEGHVRPEGRSLGLPGLEVHFCPA